VTDQLTAEGLEQLHAVATGQVADDRIPGLVALVARGDQVHVETHGTLSIGGWPVAATRCSGSPRRLSRSRPRPRSLWPEKDCSTLTSRSAGCFRNWPPPGSSSAWTARSMTPCALKDTAFWTAQTERLATSYLPTADGLAVGDEPGGAWSRPPAFGDGAAGLVSTVDDLLAFSRMLLRGGDPVLSPDAVRSMTTDQLTAEQKARGGLGADFFTGRSWGFGQAVLDSGAFGWAGGLGTTWLADPGKDLTVIVLTQRMFESPATPAAHADIQAAAYAAVP
jgi:Beta-lactamase